MEGKMKHKKILVVLVLFLAAFIGGRALADNSQWRGAPNMVHIRSIIDQLGSKLTVQSNTISTLTRQSADYQSQLAASQQLVTTLQSQIRVLNQQLDQAEMNKKLAIQQTINDMNRKIDIANNQVALAQKSLSNVQGQLKIANEKANDLQLQLAKAQQQYSDEKGQNAELTKQLDNAMQSVNALDQHAQEVLNQHQ